MILTFASIDWRRHSLGESFYFRARFNYWRFEVGEEKYLHGDINNLDYYIEEHYGKEPYDAGYMPFVESREIITRSICSYLQEKGIGDTASIREELLAWFEQWIGENPDYQQRHQ